MEEPAAGGWGTSYFGVLQTSTIGADTTREEAADVRCGIGPCGVLWHRPLRRSASESGRLRHGDGAKKGDDRCPKGLKLAIPSASTRAGIGN